MRTGVCTLEDYPDEEIALARDNKSGLVVMCISSFLEKECHRVLAPLLLNAEGYTTVGSDVNFPREDSPEKESWVTVAKKSDPKLRERN